MDLKIAVTVSAAKGHLHPMTALARQLQKRGHEVICIGPPDAARGVACAGLQFEAICGERFPPGSFATRLSEMSRLSGPEVVTYTMAWFHEACRMELEASPALLQRIRADGLVVDRIFPGTSAVAMAIDIPFVNIACTPFMDLTGTTPLWLFPWPHEDGEAARKRNRRGVEEYLRRVGSLRATVLEYLKSKAVTVDTSDVYWTDSKLACLTQIPHVFDFPGDHLPKHFHRTGPFQDGTGREPIAFPWEKLTGESLIYVSLGTQTGLRDVFQKILTAVERPGYQVVLAVGMNIMPEALETRQKNTIILQQVPQFELLKLARLCVTHAGLNTTLDALMHGVPLVAIPITHDQPGIAARILASGTGQFLPVEQLTALSLARLVEEVLGKSSYQRRALDMKSKLAGVDGLGMASDLIEKAFQVRAMRNVSAHAEQGNNNGQNLVLSSQAQPDMRTVASIG